MNNTSGTKVLIAEDDFLVCKEIERSLKTIGYEILGKASNGEQAVEMTKELKPDIILMDIEMPKMTGLEAASLIQENCPTPVIILTAHESQELVKEAGKRGVGAYLTKPPKTAEIERAVTIAISRHKDLMEMHQLNKDLEEQKNALEKALSEIKTLRGMIPICANCKKIRDDKGFWDHVEVYIKKHSEAQLSHCLCPDCAKNLYPEFYKEKSP